MPHSRAVRARQILDFLGSAHVFASALTDVMEGRVIDQVSGGELTFEHMKVLQLVATADGHNVSDVAAFMRVSNAAASKTVDKLVRAKFLRRGEGAADRRSTHLHLTKAGKQLLAKYDATRLRTIADVWKEMPAQDFQKIARILDTLSARIMNRTAAPDESCLQCGIHFRERCVLHEESGNVCTYRRRRSKPRVELR